MFAHLARPAICSRQFQQFGARWWCDKWSTFATPICIWVAFWTDRIQRFIFAHEDLCMRLLTALLSVTAFSLHRDENRQARDNDDSASAHDAWIKKGIGVLVILKRIRNAPN